MSTDHPAAEPVKTGPDQETIDKLIALAAPQSWVNWKLFQAGAPSLSMAEAAIYTDTWIQGEYEIGPLQFLNTLAEPLRRRELAPRIVLRFAFHWPTRGYVPIEGNRYNHYHGGDHFDEVAALVALTLGIRTQAGPVTRLWRETSGPLGQPVVLTDMKPIPTLLPRAQAPTVPRIYSDVNLTHLGPVGKIAHLSEEAAGTVIKCARSYQRALWIADSEPEMTWLLLVSAIETAAGFWQKDELSESELVLPDDIGNLLNEYGCPDSVRSPLADKLRHISGSTSKFIKFLLKFLPQPPLNSERPAAEHATLRLDYTNKTQLRRDFSKIYEYRSKALHEGIPFPYPMCVARHLDLKEERDFSLGASAKGATWDFTDYHPILLHTFEHITRGALLQWLDSL